MNIRKLKKLNPRLAKLVKAIIPPVDISFVRKTLEAATEQPKYPVEFISTIGCWQNYGASDKQVVKDLKKLKVPEVFKCTNVPLYRIMGIKPDMLANLYTGKNYNYKNVSSWTKNLRIAQEFIKSRWFLEFNDPHSKIAVILKKSFPNVILDLDALWGDKDFRDSLSYWEDADINAIECYEGIEFENDQREVVCGPFEFKHGDLYSLFNIEKQKWIKPPKEIKNWLKK